MAGGLYISSTEAFPGALWGEVLVSCEIFSYWLFGHCFLLATFKFYLICCLCVAGGVSLGCWNDQDKGSGIEE